MRMLSFAAVGVAGFGLAVASAGSSASNANPRSSIVTGSHAYASAIRRPLLEARAVATPSSCPTNAAHSFDGEPGSPGDDTPGGGLSAVMGGQLNSACDQWDGIGGGTLNDIGKKGAASASFIGAGQYNGILEDESFIGAGNTNTITSGDSFIGAGIGNVASGNSSFVGAGQSNLASGAVSAVVAGISNSATAYAAFVGAGEFNKVTGPGSFIGAGDYTYAQSDPTTPGNQISGTDSFIGAGDQNVVDALESFVGSGQSNTITSTGSYAAIVGGRNNYVSGEYASILGGYGNTASGSYATIAGGDSNTAAGELSFAGGYHADAGHSGSFVWSDYSSGSALLKDSAANQFVVRASGGVYLYSNEGVTTGVVLTPGSGTWASLSDRNAKTDIVPLDDDSILAKVAALPIDAWSYKSESGVRHIGPMAQDFYAAFGLGTDDRHITSIDEDGVALAAIKALHLENRRLSTQSARLGAEHGQLRASVAALVANTSASQRRLAAQSAALEHRLDVLASQIHS